jgi:hypothetical protein
VVPDGELQEQAFVRKVPGEGGEDELSRRVREVICQYILTYAIGRRNGPIMSAIQRYLHHAKLNWVVAD